MNYLLDTDIFNHFHAGNRQVVNRLAGLDTHLVAISVMTRIEVLHGRFEFLRKAASSEQLLRAQRRLGETDEALAAWQSYPSIRTFAANSPDFAT